jgi:hypothetical protein
MPEVRAVNGRVVIQIGECVTSLSYEQALAHAEMVEVAALELVADGTANELIRRMHEAGL